MALNEREAQLLAELLGRAEWPLPRAVFHALLGMTISVPLELCILDSQDRILLFERKDHEFDAMLDLGTVLRDSDNDGPLAGPIARLLKDELEGYEITYPKNIGWVHVPRGSEPWQNSTRHEVSLIFLSRLISRPGDCKGTAYLLDALPDTIIGHHRVMIRKLAQYLRDGKPILG